MKRRGILLTGVSGAGKTTIARLLSDPGSAFEQARAVTTRPRRPDDPPGTFEYLTSERFDALERDAALAVRAEYRSQRYGITHADLAAVEERGRVPILLVTPRWLRELVERSRPLGAGELAAEAFLSIFVDAPDETLDARLAQRQGAAPPDELQRQRAQDRLDRHAADHLLQNVRLELAVATIVEWWRAVS